jgi:pimeloyl-ACP methyl ester carboxylesterase
MPFANPGTAWRIALQALPIKTLQAGDDAFTYREAGAGEAIVFLHGISSGSASWVHQLIHFRAQARCIAWDAPGYGGSTPLQEQRPSASHFERALQHFLDALKIERLTLVAHSLGAIMAVAFAAKHPDCVNGMILLDPASGYGSFPHEVADAKLNSRLQQLRELGIEGLAETRSKVLVSIHGSPEAIELIEWNMRQLSVAAYTQAAQMLAGADLISDARSFHGRVLVACGSADEITPEDQCRRVAEAFSDARYFTLPSLGHASYIEDPEAVNRIISNLIGTHNG